MWSLRLWNLNDIRLVIFCKPSEYSLLVVGLKTPHSSPALLGNSKWQEPSSVNVTKSPQIATPVSKEKVIEMEILAFSTRWILLRATSLLWSKGRQFKCVGQNLFPPAYGQGCFICLTLSSPKTIYGQILPNVWRATEQNYISFNQG